MTARRLVAVLVGSGVVAVLVVVAVRVFSGGPTYESTGGVRVTVTSPEKNAVVESPLLIRGTVPGSWTFEADFGIELLDANRKPVALSYATVKGDWMTERDLPFTARLTFTPPKSDSGVLILRKANPSGLEGKADSVEIPVRFHSG